MRNEQIDKFAISFPWFAQPLLRHPDWIHQYPHSDTLQLIIILICICCCSYQLSPETKTQANLTIKRVTVDQLSGSSSLNVHLGGHMLLWQYHELHTHTHTQSPAAFFSPSFLLISQFWSSVSISVSDFWGQQSQRSNSHKPGTSTTKA